MTLHKLISRLLFLMHQTTQWRWVKCDWIRRLIQVELKPRLPGHIHFLARPIRCNFLCGEDQSKSPFIPPFSKGELLPLEKGGWEGFCIHSKQVLSYMLTFFKRFDWILIGSLVPLFVWSLLTLKSVGGTAEDSFFYRQLIWIGVGFLVMFLVASVEWRFFARSGVVLALYGGLIGLLLFLFFSGTRVKGALSW